MAQVTRRWCPGWRQPTHAHAPRGTEGDHCCVHLSLGGKSAWPLTASGKSRGTSHRGALTGLPFDPGLPKQCMHTQGFWAGHERDAQRRACSVHQCLRVRLRVSCMMPRWYNKGDESRTQTEWASRSARLIFELRSCPEQGIRAGWSEQILDCAGSRHGSQIQQSHHGGDTDFRRYKLVRVERQQHGQQVLALHVSSIAGAGDSPSPPCPSEATDTRIRGRGRTSGRDWMRCV